jgi:predicted RNA-binding Zn ribbon-like protein
MTKSIRPSPIFIADNLALDFINTLAKPWGDEIEWLNNGYDLLDWLEQAGMAHKKELTKFRGKSDIVECNEVAAQARDLRKWFRTFVTNYAGQPLNSSVLSELDGINNLLACGNNYFQIEAGNLQNHGDADKEALFLWKQLRRFDSPSNLLLPIAQAIGEFICLNDFKYVKPCKNHKCVLWFHDISKNRTRNWCSMAICGNRAKAAAYRERKKSKVA